MRYPLTIVGIGKTRRAGLCTAALNAIQEADQLWGSAALIDLFPEVETQKIVIDRNFREKLPSLLDRGSDEKIVVLGSGDPLFHGIGATIMQHFPAEQVKLYLQPTFIQEAFAMAGIPWSDAVLLSAHADFLPSFLGYVRRYRKIGILCGTEKTESTPANLAARLLKAGLNDLIVTVCGNIGSADSEVFFQGTVEACAGMDFPVLSVMLIEHASDWQPAAEGIVRPDDAFVHRRGLITKRDIRALCFSRLAIQPEALVWDIGAGSGAVSVEAAERAWRGQVIAIEKEPDLIECIQLNQQRFSIENLRIIQGSAPDALSDLPQPSAVFIGGSGGNLTGILDHLLMRRQTAPFKLVMTFALIENLIDALNWAKAHEIAADTIQAGIHETVQTGSGTRLVPKNPIFIVEMTF